MAARGTSKRAGAGSMIVIAGVLWLTGVAASPAEAVGSLALDHGQAVEPAETSRAAPVSPSGAAGLSLLGAAVVGTLWNLAIAERRRTTARTSR